MASFESQLQQKALTIITTHINADFDAMGAMLAAQKLYPDARVVFPGSQEKNLRNFFIQSMVYLFNLTEIKDIDLDKVTRLVLVDTCSADRIGPLSRLLTRPDLQIHVYDHHPAKSDDIVTPHKIQRITGATVTLMTEILKEKAIHISAEEATIMCLGIYEDTGSFTFTSTTAEDLNAAAFLVSKGANISVIANMISREISPEQIGHLNDLIQNASRHTINGVDIVLTYAVLDNYLPDFAFLVHKMVKIEEINALFVLAMMDNKVYVMGRSRTDEVDVGRIIETLGGGGHPSAAAATIKGQTLMQVEQTLLKALQLHVKGQRRARQLMSSPPITADAQTSCTEAKKILTRYNINALLVVSNIDGTRRLLGYITRQVIEKAIYHMLDHVPIKEYMTSEPAVVAPDAELFEIQEKIIGNQQRVLPVVHEGDILGVITRTDLLTVLIQHSRDMNNRSFSKTLNTTRRRTRNINRFMQERLSKRVLETLLSIGQVATDLSFNAFVVGGFVRDLFLYRPNEDIDIVIEGDGIAFAEAYARAVGARIHTHKVFGTAVIIFTDDFKIDVATARIEYYRSPAALPDVEMSSIKLDLFRRDFTINTLAIQVNPDQFGRLIDYFFAQQDLKDKAIRVLHNLSFVEDPTRVFRALRFEQRFDFTIGKLTASLIENALKMDFFKRLSGRRVFTEIRLILEEENPVNAIQRMGDFNLLQVIDPAIDLNKALIERLDGVRGVISWHDLLFTETAYFRWTIYFMVLIDNCGPVTAKQICDRLELPPKYRHILCDQRFDAQAQLLRLESRLPVSDSQLYHALHGYRTELILYMMAATRLRAVKKAISYYYTQLRDRSTAIGGQDLIAMGLTPGPVFRQILDAVLEAKLNGRLKTRDDELAYAEQWIGGHSDDHNLLDSKGLSQ
ncbi:MAG: CBS domain-containing protein [Desulfatitalea sp.]|nr:CBS domain-containing protein [Desulfatitalea sp.]NNJ99328.1 CBS domain-containing protein [Desulfatitalea sp.]